MPCIHIMHLRIDLSTFYSSSMTTPASHRPTPVCWAWCSSTSPFSSRKTLPRSARPTASGWPVPPKWPALSPLMTWMSARRMWCWRPSAAGTRPIPPHIMSIIYSYCSGCGGRCCRGNVWSTRRTTRPFGSARRYRSWWGRVFSISCGTWTIGDPSISGRVSTWPHDGVRFIIELWPLHASALG